MANVKQLQILALIMYDKFTVDIYKHDFIVVMVFPPRFDNDTSGSGNETSETLFKVSQ